MCLAVPVAVKLLHRGNRELSRNLSSYLSLAAINNGDILAAHIQPIIDSIIGGNYALVRVLPKIYAYNREAIHEHIMGLVCLLSAPSVSSSSTKTAAGASASSSSNIGNAPSSSSSSSSPSKTDTSERVALLNLFALISKRAPATLEYSLPQLADCLTSPPTAYLTLQIFLDMAQANVAPLGDYTARVMAAAREVAPQPATGSMLSLAAEFLGVVGAKLGSESTAAEVVRFLVGQLTTTGGSSKVSVSANGQSSSLDLGTTIALLRQTKTVAEVWPSVLPPVMGAIRAAVERHASSSTTVQSYLQQLGAINATAAAASNSTSTATSSSRTSASELAGYGSYRSSQFLGGGTSAGMNSQQHHSSRLMNGHGQNNISLEGGSFINTTTAANFNGRPAGSRLTSNGFHILHRSIPRLHVVSGHHGGVMGGGGGNGSNNGSGGNGSNSHGGNSIHMHRSLNALVASSNSSSSNVPSNSHPLHSSNHQQQQHHLFQNHQSVHQPINSHHHHHNRYAANRMSVESISHPSAAAASSQRSSQKSASSSYLLALQEKELRTVGAGSKSCKLSSYQPHHYHQQHHHHQMTGSSVDSQLQQTASATNTSSTANKPLTSSSSSSSHYNLRNSEKEILAAFGGMNSSSINGLGTTTSVTNAAGAGAGAKTTSGTLSSAESNVSFGPTATAAAAAVNPNSISSTATTVTAHSEHSKSSSSINKSSSGAASAADANRMSVFEPYPMRDAVQHFCEKHIDKIKAYMTKVFVKIPQPVKITIEERSKSKKVAKIYFNCQTKSEHCLYRGASHFVMRTKSSRLWIHLMFLALQARASSALCTREPSVHSLKNCWETLKLDNRTFLTLVTSSFPSAKDQEVLIEELRAARYFDVFHFNALVQAWGCFLCNHPDKATGFLGRALSGSGGGGNSGENEAGGNDLHGGPRLLLGNQEHPPVIEGTLKEKKGGKWKLFRRWRTRYFTLSGVHLYRDEVSSGGGGSGKGGVQVASSSSSASSSTPFSASASASKASRFAAAVGLTTGGGSLHRLSNLRSHSVSAGMISSSSSTSASASSKTTSSFLQQNGGGGGGQHQQPHQVELLGKVQSVRALGNARGRSIPKAFEIFTSENNKTYVLKAPNNQHNQEWMQCLSIAMAHNSSSAGGGGGNGGHDSSK